MKAPNILILMADQLAPHYTSTYGHQIVKTPNMDRLAERGCRFDAAYTPYPQCAPARFSMLSGQQSWKIRAYDNAAEFSSSIPTICHYLGHMGYHTSLSGKMHFIGPDQLHGFTERLTTDIYPADYAFTPNWEAADLRDDTWYHNMDSVHEAGVADMTFQLEFDDEAAFQGIRKIWEYARNPESQPFMQVTSFTHPHDPYVAGRRWWNLYSQDSIDMPQFDIDSIPQDPHSQRLLVGMQADVSPPSELSVLNARRAYYANTSYIDDWVGQFIDTLEQTRMLDNTIVIVTADHGDMLGERGLWYKMCFFEQSVRVPLIVAGPDIQQASIPNACSILDLLPTLLDLASGGTDRTVDLVDSIDGRSLHKLLTRDGTDNESFTVSEYSAECASHPMVMIRRNQYKYVYCDIDPPQLFDLELDPNELNNLAQSPSHKEITDSFREEVLARWDLKKIRSEIMANQKARLLIHESMAKNPKLSWDYQPYQDASQAYVRTHKTWIDMATNSRFPRFNDKMAS